MGLGRRISIMQVGLAIAGLLLFAAPAVAAPPDVPTPPTLCSTTDPTAWLTSTGFSGVSGDQAFVVVAPSDGLFFDDDTTTTDDSVSIINDVAIDTTGTANSGVAVSGSFDMICYDGQAAGSIVSDEAGIDIEQLADGEILLFIAHAITARQGVLVDHSGSGSASIRTSADITATDSGIEVAHSGAAGDVRITTSAGTTISARGGAGPAYFVPGLSGSAGIFVDRSGATVANRITILNDANIEADAAGIYVDVCSCGSGVTSTHIVSTGAIDVADGAGIYVSQGGPGNTSVLQSGKIDVTNGVGLVIDQFGDGDVTAAAVGGVSATDVGIAATHLADGRLDIVAGGTYDISDGSGIEAYHYGKGGLDISSTAIINSALDAIYVEHDEGDTTVTQSGRLTVDVGSGILIGQFGDGDASANMTGDIDATDTGIAVSHFGQHGAVAITTSAGDTIDAHGGFGPSGPTALFASRSYFGLGTGTGDITIVNGADLEAEGAGIFATLCGCTEGELNVTSTGTIHVDGAMSPTFGITLFHEGEGKTNLAASGDITVDGPTGVGVLVQKAGDGEVLISTGNVSASAAGVIVSSYDDAHVAIGVDGTITSRAGVTVDAATISASIGPNALIKVNGTGSGRYGATFFGTSDVTVAGTIDATGTEALLFGGGDATLTLLPGYVIHGNVSALDIATNKLVFGGATGDAAFDLDALGTTFTGFDSLLKTGDSTWTFTGSSFAGRITADAGTIVVNSDIPGLDLLLEDTTLKGNATLKTIWTSGGAIAPGNSIGTLVVTGDATIGVDTQYDVELNAAGASDRLEAGGRVSIDPTADVAATMESGSYGAVTKYTIVTAATNVAGTFEGVSLGSAFYTPTLTYDLNSVYLTLTRNALTLDSFATTPNQKAASAALDGAGLGAPYYNELGVLPASDVAGALDALSGDGYASLATAALDADRFVRHTTLDRRGARGVWATPYGGLSHVPSDGNGPAIDQATGGLLLGADNTVGDGWLGVLLGYGQSRYDIASRDMSATSGEFSLGAYGGADWDAFYASFGAALTARDIDATRRVVLPGVNDTFAAQYASLTTQAFTEIGYRIDMGGTTVTPFGGLAVLQSATTGYAESGSGAGALTVDPSVATALVTTLGLRLEHEIALDDERTLTLQASAAWRHAMGRASTTNTMAGAAAFTVAGTPLAADTLEVSAGTSLAMGQLSVGVDYTGSFGSGGLSNAATATLAGHF